MNADETRNERGAAPVGPSQVSGLEHLRKERDAFRDQRNGKLPACPAAHEANRTYTSAYLREWRRRNPDYAGKWRAKQQTKSGEDK